MKATNITKINPIVEMTSPVLLQCVNDECGTCPAKTGKMLWIPISAALTGSISFNFQYNFFDKSAESTSPIKYNMADGSAGTFNGSYTSYSNKPTKTWALTTHANESNPSLSPSLMRGSSMLTCGFFIVTSYGNGGWLFFRQPNPAINNVHDALCFEYNHEKKLITFRSF